MTVSCWHLFISITNQSWMEANFKTRIHTFISLVLLCAPLSESMCIFVFVFLVLLIIRFPCFVSHCLFCFLSYVPTFCSKIVFTLSSGCRYVLVHLTPICGYNFSLFSNHLLCLHWFSLSQYFFIFFLSLEFSCLFPRVVRFCILLVELLFSFRTNMFQRLFSALSFCLL